MKALTIRQPWATLIALGVKTIETRSWRAPQALIGQTIAIHAGKHTPHQLPPEARPALVTPTVHGSQRQLDRCLALNGLFGEWTPLPLGAVVATATLADCLPMAWWLDDVPSDVAHVSVDGMNANLWPHGTSFGNPECYSDQLPYGDFQPGRWAWMLTDVTPCDPVPAKGKQGLWTWQP